MGLDSGAQARPDRTFGQDTHSGQQVVHLDASPLSWTVGQHLVGYQPAAVGRLTPPDSVVGWLGVALLTKVKYRKQHQAGRGYGQQYRLHTVEETSLHEGNTLLHSL